MDKQYVVLGLGIFGSTICKTLSSFGCEVLAIDVDEECVERVSEFVTKAIVGDITDKNFLMSLGLDEFDVGIVAIGDHLEECILGVMNLKEIGIPYVIAKARNKRFKEVLEKVGADRVIRPEKEMGVKVARSLLRKNISDMIEIDENYSVADMKAPASWVGKTLVDLNLRQKYSMNILGLKDPVTKVLSLNVDPYYVIKENDEFLLIAETDKIEKFDYMVLK